MSATLLPVSPFEHQVNSAVSASMRQVLYALLPGIAVYVWFFGWGIVVSLAFASVYGLALEALMLWLRQRPLRLFLSDSSVLVTAWLLALAVPPLAPWWVLLVGMVFAVVFAKHLYGGLGYNPFNPAMVGYAVLLVSFPREVSLWPAAHGLAAHPLGLLDSLNWVLFQTLPAGVSIDAVSGATPLDTMKTQLGQAFTVAEVKTAPLFGDFGARGWEWVGNAFILGGLWLLYKRVITWHIPLAVLGGLAFMATVFFFLDPDSHPSPLFHVFSGAAILCAFFIATDPVSAATSSRGRIIYGLGIGVLIYVIRTWGGYPDGVAFAVLLMNLSAPALDYYTKPRVFGR